MNLLPFIELIFYFVIYAFLGWCAEVAFAAMKTGRFVNRGFLNGPYCPIYGFGMLLVILSLMPLQHSLPVLFLGSCLITTLLEYITGVVLEKLFHTRWWDYSCMPFNLHGHVCLLFSVLWGLACTFIIRIIHPLISGLYAWLPAPVALLVIGIAASVMLADAVATVIAVRSMNRHLQRITDLAEDLRRLSDELGEDISDRALDAKAWWECRVQPRLEALDSRADRYREDIGDTFENLRSRIDDMEDALDEKRAAYRNRMQRLHAELTRSKTERRLMDAFPDMKDLRNQQSLDRLRAFHDRLWKKR